VTPDGAGFPIWDRRQPIEHHVGAWTFVWEGGRLMEVFHLDSGSEPVDAIQAGPYDWQTDRSSATRETIAEAAAEWVNECGEAYMANVVRYRRRSE
jgi:hypothetical protein